MKASPTAPDRASILPLAAEPRAAEPRAGKPRGGLPWGRLLAGAAILCLVASGGLMWWRHGEEVFTSLVTSALAWCF